MAARPLEARRILIVDDHASVRAMLDAALRDAGANVEAVGDGVSALRRAEASPPDLILLDLSMPEIDGWTVLSQLRARPATQKVPVVIETSAEDLPSFERARREGAAAFLSKPFRLAEVVETCRRILEGARPLQGLDAPGPAGPAEVLVRDADGRVLTGVLLEMDARGGQLELESSIPVGRRLTLTLNREGTPTSHACEVRWVNRADGRYQVGFALR